MIRLHSVSFLLFLLSNSSRSDSFVCTQWDGFYFLGRGMEYDEFVLQESRNVGDNWRIDDFGKVLEDKGQRDDGN